MAPSKELKVVVTPEREEVVDECDEPVSPTGQYFNSSALSVCILAVFEFDVPVDDSPAKLALQNLFLPLSPRFSSVMVKDESSGIQRWKKVEVNLEDHLRVPVFPPGRESYDQHLEDYLRDVALEKLPQDRPLWELHIVKYPTSGAAGTMVFKLHHALGDGYSLMSALFSCLQRAEDTSLPLTFPAFRPTKLTKDGQWTRLWRKVPGVVSLLLHTVRDFGWSLWKSNLAEDSVTPLRSGAAGVEFRPVTMASVEFSLGDIRTIKDKVGGTVNDVISGVVFYGMKLYMEAMGGRDAAASADVTALVLLNTRALRGYQTIQDMSRPDTKTPWGNHFGFLHVSLPKCKNVRDVQPLEFVHSAKKSIKAKKNSLAVYLTGRLLEILRKFKGPEATAEYIHGTLRNTTLTISNMTGPREKMIIAGHPVRSFHFMVVGVPQSLTITIVSYMGKLKVTVGAEKGFIDCNLLISSMEKSFQRILEEACGNKI